MGEIARLAKRVGIGGVALAWLGVLSLTPAALGAGGGADFGDAPDGARAGYSTAPGVIGHFPSKAARPGPRHVPVSSFYLGAGESAEANSRQVNKDTVDDGASVSLTKCGSSTLKVVLNGAALPAATRTSAHVAYVNAWFDWNRDGDWADSSDKCSSEWAIRNLPVSMDKLAPDGIAVLPIGFKAGSHTSDIWDRVTLTLDQPVAGPDGGGAATPYVSGETEDYLIPPGTVGGPPHLPHLKEPPPEEEIIWRRRKRKLPPNEEPPPKKPGKFTVSCAPEPAVIPHGGTATVKFVIVDEGKGWIFGSPSTQKGPGGKASVTPVKPQPGGVPPGFVAADGFKQSGSKVDPPLRIQVVVVKFAFRRGKQTQNLSCKVLIVHWGHGNPNPFLPRVVCEGSCRTSEPPKGGTTGTSSPQPSPEPLKGSGALQEIHPNSFFDVFFSLPVERFKVVLPSSNQVSNVVTLPAAPYTCAPDTSVTANDTVLCSGSLPANVHAQGTFSATDSIAGGTAQLFGVQQGSTSFEGPFTVTGPGP